MLISLREHATSFFAKILLLLLIASFALWGIGDIFRDGSLKQILAQVEDQEITVGEYRNVLRLRKQSIRQMLGDDYSPELMKQLGIERLVLNEMIDFILLQKETAALGINVDDKLLAQQIHQNPAFRNETGHFDSSLFKNSLRSLGMSEEYYLNKLGNETAANLLLGSFDGGALLPHSLVRQLYMAHAEQRRADIYIIPQRVIKEIPVPDDATLKSYYDELKEDFAAPEYRRLAYTAVEYAALREKTEISDEAIKSYYDEHIDNFTIPEKRQVEQLLYSSVEDAQKAGELARQGKSLAQIAKKILPINKDALSLGLVERESLPEKARDIVFSLDKGTISEPVETAFGWHIFAVKKIAPQTTRKLAKVRKEIAEELADLQAEEELYQLANALEDRIAGGMKLKEAAEELGLPFRETPAIDHTGKTAEGIIQRDLPAYDDFLSTAFAQAEDEEPHLVPAGDNAYFMVEVQEIIPKRIRSLDEVRTQVVAAWQRKEKNKRLGELAKELAESMRKDRQAALSRMKLLGIRAFTSGSISRDTTTLPATSGLKNFPLPPALTADIFSLAQGENSDAHQLYNGDYAIAVVKAVEPAPAPASDDDPALVATADKLKQQYVQEIERQYMSYLRKKYAVTINATLFSAILADGQ